MKSWTKAPLENKVFSISLNGCTRTRGRVGLGARQVLRIAVGHAGSNTGSNVGHAGRWGAAGHHATVLAPTTPIRFATSQSQADNPWSGFPTIVILVQPASYISSHWCLLSVLVLISSIAFKLYLLWYSMIICWNISKHGKLQDWVCDVFCQLMLVETSHANLWQLGPGPTQVTHPATLF